MTSPFQGISGALASAGQAQATVTSAVTTAIAPAAPVSTKISTIVHVANKRTAILNVILPDELFTAVNATLDTTVTAYHVASSSFSILSQSYAARPTGPILEIIEVKVDSVVNNIGSITVPNIPKVSVTNILKSLPSFPEDVPTKADVIEYVEEKIHVLKKQKQEAAIAKNTSDVIKSKNSFDVMNQRIAAEN